jgi:hypothetical protein
LHPKIPRFYTPARGLHRRMAPWRHFVHERDPETCDSRVEK